MIAALARDGAIVPARKFQPDQIQPASLDLRLGEVAYRVRASFLPGPETTVAERIEELKLHEIILGHGAVLETGCVYIVPLIERLALPANIAGAANPKSSTGRLDVFTRVIADKTRGFDRIKPGYHGPLYAEISPRTFPVLVRTGSRLSQLRFRQGTRSSIPMLCAPSMRARRWSMTAGRRERGHCRQRRSLGFDPLCFRPGGRDRQRSYCWLSCQASYGLDRYRAARRL